MSFFQKLDFIENSSKILKENNNKKNEFLSNFPLSELVQFGEENSNEEVNNLYSIFLFSYIEQSIYLKNIEKIQLLLKYINSDLSKFCEWKHWKNHQEEIKLLIENIESEFKSNQENPLKLIYSLHEMKKNWKFGFLLNVLMRYLVISYIILKREELFPSGSENELDNFFQKSKIYTLKQIPTEIICAFFPKILSTNLKLFNKNFERKHFATKKSVNLNQTINILQLEDKFFVVYHYEFNEILLKNKFNDILSCFIGILYNLIDFHKKIIKDFLNKESKSNMARIKKLKNKLQDNISFIEKTSVENNFINDIGKVNLREKINELDDIYLLNLEDIKNKVNYFYNFKEKEENHNQNNFFLRESVKLIRKNDKKITKENNYFFNVPEKKKILEKKTIEKKNEEEFKIDKNNDNFQNQIKINSNEISKKKKNL